MQEEGYVSQLRTSSDEKSEMDSIHSLAVSSLLQKHLSVDG